VATLGLAAELVSRFWLGLGTPPLYRADPLLEYQFQPHQELRRFGNRISINAYGLRGAPLTSHPDPGVKRVLMFGDSVLWGGALMDQAQIASSLLPSLMPPGSQVELVPAATPSWGPANWLGFSRRYGFLGANTMLLLISSHDADDWPSYEPLAQQPDKPTRRPVLALQEALFRYGSRLVAPARPAPATAEAAERRRRSLAALTDLIRASRQAGVRPLAVQFWERGEIADAIAEGQLQSGHAAIAAVLKEEAVPTFQAGPAMALCAQRAGQAPSSLFIDSIHPYTILGQRCLAEVVAQALKFDQ
jgi:hypothetical protein